MANCDFLQHEQAENPAFSEDCQQRIEQAEDGILIMDDQGNILLENCRLSEMLGYSPQEISRLHILDTCLDEEKPITENMLQRLGAGESLVFVSRMRRKDGTSFPVEANVIRLADGMRRAIVREVSERKLAEEALRREKAFSDHVMDSLPGIFYMTDAGSRLIRWNRKASEVTGYEDVELARMHAYDFFEDSDDLQRRDTLETAETSVETNLITKAHARIPYHFTGRWLQRGDESYLIGLGIDISARVKAEEALRESEAKLQALMDSCPVAIVWTNANGRIEYLNHHFTELFGYTRDDLPTLPEWYRHAYPDPGRRAIMAARTQAEIAQAETDRRPITPFESVLTCKDGNTRWVIINGVWSCDRLMLIFTDITERKRDEEELRALQTRLLEAAIRDPLTGLYNRRYLEETLKRELARAERERRPLSILMGDIDHFKRLNDTYGHQAGDEVLKALGKLLRRHARRSDVPCRYGGEEFVVVLPDMPSESAGERAEQVRRGFADLRIAFGSVQLSSTFSIGVSVYPADGTRVEELIRAADQALYEAKQTGRDRVCIASHLDRDVQDGMTTKDIADRGGYVHEADMTIPDTGLPESP
ncbi:MAG: domain S-box/diguanylate cyclase protein [Proteobacteria bacterium]|nr:domain S-box/diguanylate cyclase protein [Pseudomonadota bacterium]